VPGRERLPSADIVQFGNNIKVTNIELALSSHKVAVPKAPDEFRVLVFGDSGTWGRYLHPEETLVSKLDSLNLIHPLTKQKIRFYNLGLTYPSIVKDLIILDKAMVYDPDMIIMFVTLHGFTVAPQ
jgi:hypothetical protein